MKNFRNPILVHLAALLVVLLAGFGLGNFLHQAIAHSGSDHEEGSPLRCAVCAASQHALADLAPQFVPTASMELESSEVPTLVASVVQTEPAASAPRAPPVAA